MILAPNFFMEMEILEAIFTRRSIRRYTGEKIEEQKVLEILKAGMYAPSARNCQPWHFVVVDDRERMDAFMKVHPYAGMMKDASHGILVCGDLKLQNGPGYWTVDCGAATQNILLAAHGLGLGGVWLGICPREERMKAVHALFALPQHIQPYAMISLGIPAEKKATPDRFHADRVHFNNW